MPNFNAELLDPGIRKTVVLLRSHGFDTTDSGDGKSKFALPEVDTSAMSVPNVAMVVRPAADLLVEADRLQALLVGLGLDPSETVRDEDMDQEYPAWQIEGCYSPPNREFALLLLTGVDDEKIARTATGKRG